MIGSSYVPMTRAEVHEHLQELTEVLVEALSREPVPHRPGYEIGARLVDAHFTGTDTLAARSSCSATTCWSSWAPRPTTGSVTAGGTAGRLAAGYARACASGRWPSRRRSRGRAGRA